MNTCKRKFLLFPLIISLLLSLPSCAPVTSHYAVLDDYLLKGDVTSADAVIEKNKGNYGERNAVLYFMDRGMTLHIAGRYAESNQVLEMAEQRIEDLFTRRVSSEAAAFLTNDNLLQYEGEDFEKVMVNLIRALNYVYMGDIENALVEARKVDHKLNLINDRYAGKKNAYKEDAFARYLAGILYEAGGYSEQNDAWVSYRKSLQTFEDYAAFYSTPIPPVAVQDVLRLSDALGQQDILEEMKKQFPDAEVQSYSANKDKGEVVFISFNGKAPIKEDNFLDIPLSPEALVYVLETSKENRDVKNTVRGVSAIQGELIRIAFPKFVPQKSEIAYADVSLIPQEAGSVIEKRTVLMEDITAIAVRNLNDRFTRIAAKAVARAAVKKVLAVAIQQRAEKEGGPMAGLLAGVVANAAAFATEQADKRSWRTLPDEIQLARITAPPGTYDVHIKYIGKNGGVLSQKVIPNITIKTGEKKFLSNRILR
ncbi:MAG: hypothetical protein HZA08_02110 [Nitrospirae bacterium]|nr:hypothetical protein [Nitrospirota bacterium]